MASTTTTTTIGIIAAIAVMAALVVGTNFFINTPAEKTVENFSVKLDAQHLSRSGNSLVTDNFQIVAINEDGKGSLIDSDSGDRESFAISKEEMSLITSMVTTTGFMQIPQTDYPVKSGASNYTKYLLEVQLEDQRKTFQWADEQASEVIVPPIVTRLAEKIQDSAR